MSRFRLQSGLVALLLALSIGLFGFNPAMAQSTEAINAYNQGIQAYNQGITDQALKHFRKATDLYPQYTDAFYNMGSIHYQAGRYGEAKAAFQRTVDLNPTDNQAKYNLGLTLEKLHDYEGAVRIFSQVPVNDKKYPQARQKADQIQAMLAQAQPKPQPKPQSTTTGVPGGSNPQGGYSIMDPAPKLSVQTFAKGFAGPTGMTIGPGGFMYVANYSKNAIYKVGAGGEKVMFAEGESLNGPIGLVYNAKANEMYVANYLKNNVIRISQEGKMSVMASGLNKPYNLYLDTMNNVLYVSEQETNTVSKIDLPL